MDDYFKISKDYKSIDWEAYEKDNKAEAEKIFEKFYSLKKIRKDKILKIEGKNVSSSDIFYIFTFSDNDGSYYSDLEHGDLFKNLDHLIISQH